MEICRHCTFVQTSVPFSDEGLGRLYADYRSDSYNQERISYEPEYAAIASQVGKGDQEVQVRTVGLTQWLEPMIHAAPDFTMLDYGGADGKFLPLLPGTKFVYEISNIDPVPGVTLIKDESELSVYSYIQIAHVLEHVANPLELTRKAASFLSRDGYLYIEVPQELSDDELNRLLNGDQSIGLPIHEHINRYSGKSVTELLRSLGLEIVAVEPVQVDYEWTKATVIRALARRTS